ncbi:MAG: hypothetical protein UW75_C0039G0013 [Parcubacteria group bacterium GW2011_GWF2_44_8]|nr:MAG: hypothetical protein UW75_C0039G0013 [Parcubacteria group bacterium GW2011_GWF2_44_8]OFZ33091.1 MAG: hypothetical protein A3D17_13145 [Bdellovibrionales bacterium RIFCSPHIGHO2_02_FULL_40_15]
MKNQSIVIIIGLAVLVVGAVAYSFGTSRSANNSMDMNMEMNTQDDVPAGMHRMPDGSLMGNPNTPTNQNDLNMGMMGGMDHSTMVVKSEREFLEGMIPHHQEAVDTAKEVIARGGSTPEIKKLAEDIVVAQEKEIAMMKGWYQAWYGEAYVVDPNDYEPMMRDLSKLSGAALDKVFLEDMIMHHMGAVMMAQSVQPYIEHKEMTDLTKVIVETQTEEIQLMRKMLGGL